MLTGYVAAPNFADELAFELGSSLVSRGERLLLAEGPPRDVAWVQNVWLEPREIAIESITDAARKLRAMQRNWVLLGERLHRRAALIQEQLPHVSLRPIVFGSEPPRAPLGSWTLCARDRLLASARCTSPFPHGEARFVEDKTGPPNRAYLKLWELFTLCGRQPRPGEHCLDLGSSPGGWTWVLAQLGARVTSVDKAPLDPRVARLPGVQWLAQSAFALDPDACGQIDWLFADIACYPRRLLSLVTRWLEHGSARSFVCTIKFQGATDHEAARAFASIPGSRLLHLSHNKHELTWLRLAPEREPP